MPLSLNVSALFHEHSGSGWDHSDNRSLRVGLLLPALLLSPHGCLTQFLDSLPPISASSYHFSHPSAHGLGIEASNAYCDGKQPSMPAFFLVKTQEPCVLRLLPLVGLLTVYLPWYCQLDDYELLTCLGPQHDIWS